MIAILAQLPDPVVGPLIQACILGPIVVWFMWRDGQERQRYQAREEKLDAKIDSMLEAMNHLVRITGIEVMTRPNVADRTKTETQELINATEGRRAR